MAALFLFYCSTKQLNKIRQRRENTGAKSTIEKPKASPKRTLDPPTHHGQKEKANDERDDKWEKRIADNGNETVGDNEPTDLKRLIQTRLDKGEIDFDEYKAICTACGITNEKNKTL